jgi:hypothetical protein
VREQTNSNTVQCNVCKRNCFFSKKKKKNVSTINTCKTSKEKKLSLKKYTLQWNLSFHFQLSHPASIGGGVRRDVSENTKCKNSQRSFGKHGIYVLFLFWLISADLALMAEWRSVEQEEFTWALSQTGICSENKNPPFFFSSSVANLATIPCNSSEAWQIVARVCSKSFCRF